MVKPLKIKEVHQGPRCPKYSSRVNKTKFAVSSELIRALACFSLQQGLRSSCELLRTKDFKNEPSGFFRNLQDPPRTYRNLQEPSGTFRNLQKPENFTLSTDIQTDR